MKTHLLKCSLSVALLSLAACSGGGGGGGGSANGDAAAPNSSITAPPTVAKGTSAELDTITGSGAQTTSFLNSAVTSFDINTLMDQVSLPGFKQRGGDSSCFQAVTPESDWVDNDQDGFYKNLSMKLNNCTETETDGDFAGYTWSETSSIASTDANDSLKASNGTLTGKGDTTWKDSNGTIVAKGFTAGNLTLDIAKAKLTMNYKDGGFNNVSSPKVDNGYMAFWLTLAVTDPDVSPAATVTGYLQIYKEGKGLVTLGVSSTGYNYDEGCLTGGSITLKYADGSTAVGPTAKDLCFTKQVSR